MYSFSQLMPSVTRPSGTVCMYNITSSKKLYRTFTFTVDTTVTLSLIQSKNGVQTTITANNYRNLLSSERKLSSVTNSYTVAGADYVFMSYQNSGDSTGFVSTLGVDKTPNPSNSTSSQESSSSGDSVIIIAAVCSVVGLIAVGLAVVGTVLCLWRRKIFKRAKAAKERKEAYKADDIASKSKANSNFINIDNNWLPVNDSNKQRWSKEDSWNKLPENKMNKGIFISLINHRSGRELTWFDSK